MKPMELLAEIRREGRPAENKSAYLERGRAVQLTKQFTCRLCAAAVSLLLGRVGRWSGKEIARSALSLARSAHAERDNKSCVFVCATGAH
ncbi:hypothetical protein EVAR_59406_1 [Eumeta japonica]|uniref:Uncharacterized protein n=1 Tax=Eumeta variegata TaxID=151549 RepID=A0A4C1Z450_EUMVA|nr:hypothetical protein EVAR_59406_1 [Eumeta japonica]